MCKRLIPVLILYGNAALLASMPTYGGQTPGIASPWNGPWGGGYRMGEPYSPMSNPYVRAGYPVAGPPYGGQPYDDNPWPGYAYGSQQMAQPLPGGGYILPPGAGGGMLPGVYER